MISSDHKTIRPMHAGTAIEWHAVAMKAKNVPSADQYIRRDYRKGFSIHA